MPFTEHSLQAVLIHLSVVLIDYHERQIRDAPETEVFQYFTAAAFLSQIRFALKRYNSKIVGRFNSALRSTEQDGSTRFFKFEGDELEFQKRSVPE